MTRIFIDVYPDNTFTTGTYHGDPVAHAANQSVGVITYMTDCLGGIEGFGTKLGRYLSGGGAGVTAVRRYIGPWRYWGAFCIKTWDCWFERVEGFKRRERLPLKKEAAELRIKAVLANNGELGLGTLKNRLRSLPQLQLLDSLADLVKRGDIIEHRYRHPVNNVETASYRLFDASSEPL